MRWLPIESALDDRKQQSFWQIAVWKTLNSTRQVFTQTHWILRLMLTADVAPVLAMTDDEVYDIFTMIDIASLRPEDTVIGPFGMFHTKNSLRTLLNSHHSVEKDAFDKTTGKKCVYSKLLEFLLCWRLLYITIDY
jgi:hypothetical protein